ncbi:MAG: hypothetical protein KGI50_07100 [Patescibacteria group bacterium]|nr:hypothetical protein [Patescibacteria group bacterium]
MNNKLVDGGSSGDKLRSPVLNEDATFAATIPAGTPVVLALNGTDDGLAVVMPSTAGAAQTEALFYGVAQTALPYNTNVRGYALRNGLATNAIVCIATRAASSNSWTSSASMASWQCLSVDTINNCFTTVSASAGASRYQAFAILAQSVASIAASATATTDTRTAITQACKVWVNLL